MPSTTASPGSACSSLPNDCFKVSARETEVHKLVGRLVSSHLASAEPLVPSTISRYGGAQPTSIVVKVSPADVLADADVTLTAQSAESVRYYGDGSLVRLRAPQIAGWTFFQWIINAETGPMGPGSRETTVVVDAPRSATPVYTLNP
ncbi:MAG: hypothetical protein AB7Q17_04665 [Phycisphaerae bacterium]